VFRTTRGVARRYSVSERKRSSFRGKVIYGRRRERTLKKRSQREKSRFFIGKKITL